MQSSSSCSKRSSRSKRSNINPSLLECNWKQDVLAKLPSLVV